MSPRRPELPLHVVGIGSMVVDRVHRAPRIITGDEKAILRDIAPGLPVRRYVGGVVLNQLGWAAALGLRAGIFGRQADDENGRFLRAAMDRMGIRRLIMLDGSASSVAEIFVDDAGGRAIYMAPGATSETTPDHVQRCRSLIHRARRLTTEVSQLPLETANEALAVAREIGIPTVVDLDVPPSDALATLGSKAMLEAVLRGADLLKPSKSAAREVAPGAPDALALARAVRERYGNEVVVVTDGEAGCAIASDDFEGCVPGQPVKVVDTTGAGDAFLGGLLTALEHGLGWEEGARLANACGAACVEHLGAFPDEPLAARERVLELYAGPELPLAPLAGAGAEGPEAGTAAAFEVLDVALEELAAMRRRIEPAAFEAAAALIRTTESDGGRVHVTGIGKPEHVAHYAASLLASTGTPATFLHTTECVHGSAGQVVPGDVVIAVSNSGETEETLTAVNAVRRLGARILVVTGKPKSTLARVGDVVLDAGVGREGGPLGLAPRTSVAAELLVLAALAASLQQQRGFSKADYNARHPAGSLGRKSSR